MGLEKTERTNYVTILGSDGSLRLTVPEGTPGSEKRDYETSDGQKGSKNELVFNKLSGMITGVSFHEGDYGTNLMLVVNDGTGPITLAVNTAQAFGEDLMKKLPNVNLDASVSLIPFAFENDKGKAVKGITVLQGDTKVQNFYYDPEAKKNVNGFPEPEGDTKGYKTDDWKVYFIQVRKFLVKQVTEKIVPKFKDAPAPASAPAAEAPSDALLDEWANGEKTDGK